jgi:hypothetical protein
MTSAWAIARITYHAPSGAASARGAVTDAKAVAVHQGAGSALVRLLQLALGRHEAYESGKSLPSRASISATDADASEYARDMSNMDGVLDTLLYTCAALLNLSTLKVNQLVLARLGVATLLGAAGVLANAARSERCPVDERLLSADMLAATITNVASHPQNRTRLYKAELRGSLALQRELIGQADGPSAPLPPLPTPPTGEPWRQRTYVRSGRAEAAAVIASDVPQRCRPKAVFPAIAKLASERGATSNEARGLLDATEEKAGSMAPEVQAEASADVTVTGLFHAWIDDTFQELVEEAETGIAPTKQFRMVDPETGAWQNEREGFPLLAAALRRPAAHLWEECANARAVRGAARWAPAISEYRQAVPLAPGTKLTASSVMGPDTARLLCVNVPRAFQSNLIAAAGQLRSAGRIQAALPLQHTRPSTSDRIAGRTPLTVVTPAVKGDAVLPFPELSNKVRTTNLRTIGNCRPALEWQICSCSKFQLLCNL